MYFIIKKLYVFIMYINIIILYIVNDLYFLDCFKFCFYCLFFFEIQNMYVYNVIEMIEYSGKCDVFEYIVI